MISRANEEMLIIMDKWVTNTNQDGTCTGALPLAMLNWHWIYQQ